MAYASIRLFMVSVVFCFVLLPISAKPHSVDPPLATAFEQSAILKQLIANRTADALELTNGISIEVRSASFRRLRGPTYIAAICGRSRFLVFFWTSSAQTPTLKSSPAFGPVLQQLVGPLIIASSPYAKRGVLWGKRTGGTSAPKATSLCSWRKVQAATSIRHCHNPLLHPPVGLDRVQESDLSKARGSLPGGPRRGRSGSKPGTLRTRPTPV